MKKLYQYLPFLALAFAIVFNLWLYRAELIIKGDPNDNIFQFTLVNRANTVWQQYGCPWNIGCLVRLTDHWVPEFAQGYPLPFYYSHLPQIGIVGSYQLVIHPLCSLFSGNCSLFDYYHVLTYLALCLIPLSAFLAFRIMGFSPLTQVFAVLLASHISTDGLYGMDQSSYLWRGYGLTSQLFATLFMPLAYAVTFKALLKTNDSKFSIRNFTLSKGMGQTVRPKVEGWQFGNSQLAILFLFLTLSSHFGLGYITLISLSTLLFLNLDRKEIIWRAKRLFFIVAVTVGLLSYWIIPFLWQGNFNAVSFWDPIWKFNSFGHQNVFTRFFQGDLIDFGRFPVLTILTLIGFFAILLKNSTRTPSADEGLPTANSQQPIANSSSTHVPIALLFPLWMLLFFGRTTWGPLIDLLPGTAGFHLHRFINGLHFSVLFLAPIGAVWIVDKGQVLLKLLISHLGNLSYLGYLKKLRLTTIEVGSSLAAIALALLVFLPPVYQQTITYANPNATWLNTANVRFKQDQPSFTSLLNALHTLPSGRVYAGKPGYWGKDQSVGDTKLYMALSVNAFEVGEFMPETWSPNSDTEQFFDDRFKHLYDLYNFRYVISPEPVKFPDFVKRIGTYGKYILSEISTGGYFTIGKSNLAVYANRTNYANLVHLWLTSPLVEKKIFPILTFDKRGIPSTIHNINMIDSTTYQWSQMGQADGKDVSIFSLSPLGLPSNYSTPSAKFSDERVKAGQEYTTRVTVDQNCTDCFVVFKATYHPNWKVYVDGNKAEKMIVFPFFIGIPITTGTHTVEAKYETSNVKVLLLGCALLFVALWISRRKLKRLIKF